MCVCVCGCVCVCACRSWVQMENEQQASKQTSKHKSRVTRTKRQCEDTASQVQCFADVSRIHTKTGSIVRFTVFLCPLAAVGPCGVAASGWTSPCAVQTQRRVAPQPHVARLHRQTTPPCFASVTRRLCHQQMQMQMQRAQTPPAAWCLQMKRGCAGRLKVHLLGCQGAQACL